MNKENFFINLFKSRYIGDDGALIEKNLVVNSDSFFENIHFKREWFSFYEIGKKAMLVNISDAIVMDAKPKYAILNIAFGNDLTKDNLIELANGINDVANRYGIKIIGGDTISNNKLDISITLISKTKKAIFRKGLKYNDLLCFTGNLGESNLDLKKLLKNKKIKKTSKFISPKLNPNFFYHISKYLTTAIDISDGLFFECERLSKINKKGIFFFQKIDKNTRCSGEEYEILFTFNKKYLPYIKNIAKKYKVKINIFGKINRSKFKQACKPHHF